MVDGLALGELQGSILKERKELAEDGAVVVSLILSPAGDLLAPPQFESRGFIHLEDAEKLREELTRSIEKIVESMGAKAASDQPLLETKICGRMRDSLRRYGRSKPAILPLITVVGGSPSRSETAEQGRRRRS